MLELPETLNDFRLQGTFFNATLLLWRRAQELDDRNAPQVQPAIRLLNGRKRKGLRGLKSSVAGVKQQLPHLYHDVLQLVVRVGQVGRRQDQQSPLFIELIQESAERLHIRFDLQRCKTHEVVTPPLLAVLPDGADSRSHRGGSPSQSPLNWQKRLDTPLSSYPPSQRYSHVAP